MKGTFGKGSMIILAILLVFGLAFNVGAQTKKPPVVGISTGSSGTSWRNIMIDALQQVGKEYKGSGKIADFRIVNNVTNGDATEQANIIRDFTSKGVNIIMVNPNSPDALNGVIKEAQDAGILVVSFDATVTAPNVLNVTLDHYAWNTKNVEFIASTLKEGNAIQIYGLDGHPAKTTRIRANPDVLKKYPKIKLIAGATSERSTRRRPRKWPPRSSAPARGSTPSLLRTARRTRASFPPFSMRASCPKSCSAIREPPFSRNGELRDKKADFKACAEPNPPESADRLPRMALQLITESSSSRRPQEQHLLLSSRMSITDKNLRRGGRC